MNGESKTFYGAVREFNIRLGYLIRMIGESMQPDYWACINCGHVKYYKEEIMCCECGIGEMIYKGDLK
ncbi:hypothetical protein LCGC14_1387380 [marine sediment metagenome]|uniref:Rubredoxin-like domain-containing protein n=1 Tax=marine sediment metagenome TaxID=412755 RepID=A0A0F9K103_9ZZZZ